MKNNLTLVILVSLPVYLLCSCKKKAEDTSDPVTPKTVCSIRSFIFKDINPSVQASVDTNSRTIKFLINPGVDPSGLSPEIRLTDSNATIFPASYTTLNFLSAQSYTVTAEDRVSKAIYTTELLRPTPTLKDIPTPPKYLCIYYAWPSVVNGSLGNTTTAINYFKNYDIIVFGGGLWETSHGDHLKTKQIISGIKAAKPSVRIFGYVDVGVTTQNLTTAQLYQAIDGWKLMGVDGVFGDDFESAYLVTRARQNQFIDYAHSKALSVFANSWVIDESMAGEDCHLSGTFNDFILLESYFISDGSYTSLQFNIDRSNKAYYYMRTKGIGVACVARDLPSALNSSTNLSDKFKQSWHAAAMYNFDAYQYTDSNFSSPAGALYHYANPVTSYGTSWNEFNWIKKVSANRYERSTNNTTFFITGDGVSSGTGGH